MISLAISKTPELLIKLPPATASNTIAIVATSSTQNQLQRVASGPTFHQFEFQLIGRFEFQLIDLVCHSLTSLVLFFLENSFINNFLYKGKLF